MKLVTTLRYYGVSPWEIEVIYGYLVGRFTITQVELESDYEYASFLDVNIPVSFSDEFFQWFEYKRWEKIKSVFKEMKRRRGSKNALKIQINFAGTPNVSFVIDASEKEWFYNAIEKMDFVLELLPYHIEKMPQGATHIGYKFHTGTVRWRLDTAKSDGINYIYKENNWRII